MASFRYTKCNELANDSRGTECGEDASIDLGWLHIECPDAIFKSIIYIKVTDLCALIYAAMQKDRSAGSNKAIERPRKRTRSSRSTAP